VALEQTLNKTSIRMALATGRTRLRSESLINYNSNTILFRDFLKSFDNVIETPNIGKQKVLLFTLVRAPRNFFRITNDNSANA